MPSKINGYRIRFRHKKTKQVNAAPEAQGPIFSQQGTVASFLLLGNPYILESGVQRLEKQLHRSGYGSNQNPEQSYHKTKIIDLCIILF